jgi:class 3 adenylate cyclase
MNKQRLEMLSVVQTLAAELPHPIGIRIGIHRGSAVAGVIGSSKFSYDIWGDTVNTASRIESSGESGAIQVSEAVYHALNKRYAFRPRGRVDIKGKGEMSTYFLVGKA